MSLQANSDTSFYLDGELIDTVMLNYQVETSPMKGRIHTKKQAVAKLRIVAFGLKSGWDEFSESDIQRWVRDCS